MNKQINDFKESLESFKKYSKCTIDSYIEDCSLFFKYLCELDIPLDKVDTIVIRNYIVDEIARGVSKRSIKRRISSLKKFYNYMSSKNVGYVKDNPFIITNSPKAEIKLPKYLDDVQVKEIIDKNKDRVDFLKERDQAILELLYFSGIRASELTSIRLQDCDFSRNCIIVTGKGKKERIVPFTKECQISINAYLKYTRPKLYAKSKIHSPYLFLNIRGGRLTVRGLELLLKRIEEKVGTNYNLYPHLMRHSFATNLLSKGAPLVTVKELLGHESAGTTAIYSHVTEETIMRNAALLPRNKKSK